MTAETVQKTLDGREIVSTVDPERVRVRVCRRTQTELHRMRMRGLTMVQSADLGSKLTKFILNKLNKNDVQILMATEDDQVIEQTLSKLFIKN